MSLLPQLNNTTTMIVELLLKKSRLFIVTTCYSSAVLSEHLSVPLRHVVIIELGRQGLKDDKLTFCTQTGDMLIIFVNFDKIK